ncbi:N-acyl-D-amino-acid deacylase family protein [Pseudemcibacter aquimaris]|uniref:N-acyl-D-amino-acid deacylase family protein n=1 Tax=Pseudemcibacter aquimaris TaxID=2857064 RepID=UPI002012BC9D|nr:D-aminoacylase [Pseudemcibacter aquimaris]MCC3862339.1 D-aminoacylase [Pseudemcibacter aquimaris]WDU59230.1 D-aminoacylase [Pseudemcibacter aquimaris]
MKLKHFALLAITSILTACANQEESVQKQYDTVIRGGLIHDGLGSEGKIGDVAIQGDRIVAIGDLGDVSGKHEIDANGLIVAPGFINVLSWAAEPLTYDGRGMSDLKQGVTLEIFGEGSSPGPLNDEMKKSQLEAQGEMKFDIPWNSLGEFLQHLEDKGTSLNVASFVGATTVRINELGYENRLPTDEEMTRMQQHVIYAMNEGALGLGTSLIYAPASYSDTNELISLSKAASVCGGSYISHMRSEGNKFEEAVEELITISKEANIPAEVYHLKAAGKENYAKMDKVIARIEEERAAGYDIRANMYNYTAGSTGLDAMIPPWIQEGGIDNWIKNMQDPELRARALSEMKDPNRAWESLGAASGYENVVLAGFTNPDLRHYTGKRLTEIAEERGASPEETAMDLVAENGADVSTIYFMMSEENIRKKLALPWVGFGSDARAIPNEGLFLNSSTHPRTYGNFARLLGKYVRDEKALTMSDAIRRMTSMPAINLKLKDRGAIKEGYFADLAIFDPAKISDTATFEEPHQYAEGMVHVFVNGGHALKDGEHNNVFSGRFVKRNGWQDQCNINDML